MHGVGIEAIAERVAERDALPALCGDADLDHAVGSCDEVRC